MKQVLLVASFGGHFEQMKILLGDHAFKDFIWVSTKSLDSSFGASHHVMDCSATHPFRCVICFFQSLFLLIKLKPQKIVSTGAAPGVFFVLLGKLFGASCLWVDSLANSERLSLSARIVRIFGVRVWTQWESLAKSTGAEYKGAVL